MEVVKEKSDISNLVDNQIYGDDYFVVYERIV